jgi:hypothetical protein
LIFSFVALCTTRGSSQTLAWSSAQQYDQGVETSLAALPTGLVLEAHQTHSFGGNDLWYHLGSLHGSSLTWEGSQLFPWRGFWPNVAISKEGYVIFVYSSRPGKSSSDLYYAVGKINPYGPANQTIQWLTESLRWDSGFHSSIAIKDTDGTIVGVHESGSGGTGLYYRVGHLNNPNAGDYTIAWDSGPHGIKYDDGINPHIAINNLDQVVEVHQVAGERLLHYRRGNRSGGTIIFGGSQRYNSSGKEPAVALLDNGSVIELNNGSNFMYAMTGVLSPSAPWAVDWSPILTKLSNQDSDSAEYPALASNGLYAVGTWTLYRDFSGFSSGLLYDSVAKLP